MQGEIIKYFANMIEEELGIIYAEHNYFQLESRLQEVANYFLFSNIEELYQKTRTSFTSEFKKVLFDVATNNETSFFRDPKIFEAIKLKTLPCMLSMLIASETLMIWSAACSSGQEPYSLSMLLNEETDAGRFKSKYKIVATDVCERILTRASQGKYSQLEVSRGLSPELLKKYFIQNESFWQVKPELKNSIQFQLFNLKSQFSALEKFHLILCRNVLIYQKPESKIEIIKKLTKHIVPGGYLILGAGESLLGISNDFETITGDGVVFYRLKSNQSLNVA